MSRSLRHIPNEEQPTRRYVPVSEAPTVRIPPPERVQRRGPRVLLGVGILFALALLAAGVALLALYRADLILPGVEVAGLQVEVGGRSVTEATAALEQAWARRVIHLEGDGGGRAFTPAELGIYFDAAATAERAHAAGRDARSVDQLRQALLGGAAVAPVWSIDLSAAESSLAVRAAELTVAPTDAQFRYGDGTVNILPESPGSTLDVAATVQWLEQNAATAITTGRAPLLMRSLTPAVAAADLQPLHDQAVEYLQQDLTLRLYDPVTDESHAGSLAWRQWVDLSAEGSVLQVAVDQRGIEADLASEIGARYPGRRVDMAAAVPAVAGALEGRLNGTDTASLTLRLYHEPGTHVVQSGETLSSIGRDYGIPYPWIQQANPGTGDGLSVGQSLVIPSPDVMLPLPVVENKRIEVSISQQRMWAYENGALLWEWPASTGIDDSPTAPGIFQIQSHESNAYASNWDLWMPYFMGIYRPVPTSDFMNGFHGFPTRNGSNLLWTGSLGHKVTYGCILVSTENATRLYEWADEGVVVEVTP